MLQEMHLRHVRRVGKESDSLARESIADQSETSTALTCSDSFLLMVQKP